MTEEAVLLSKSMILREMIVKGKTQFAEEYLKKCLVTFSTQFSFLSSLLLKYSSYIKKHYSSSSSSEHAISFMIE